MRDSLQRALGYAPTGLATEQMLFILHGTGSNGKSTLLQTLIGLLGDYAATTPLSTLLVKRGDSIPNDIAQLKGARFVAASEAEHEHRLAESVIKQLTGGDRISARFLYREFFEFKPELKLFISTNHKPTIRGTDHAIWRRIRLIPFTIRISDDEQDKGLLDKLSNGCGLRTKSSSRRASARPSARSRSWRP